MQDRKDEEEPQFLEQPVAVAAAAPVVRQVVVAAAETVGPWGKQIRCSTPELPVYILPVEVRQSTMGVVTRMVPRTGLGLDLSPPLEWEERPLHLQRGFVLDQPPVPVVVALHRKLLVRRMEPEPEPGTEPVRHRMDYSVTAAHAQRQVATVMVVEPLP